MARIRAVFFDIDGTLLDSNDAHAHAWLDSLHGHGINVPFESVRSRIGMGGDKLLPEVAAVDVDSVIGKSITKRRSAIMKGHYMGDVGPFHGARVLVDRLRSRGLLAAAVSSATSDDLGALLTAAGVADLMDAVIAGDDAEASKPDPDLVQVALDRLGLLPDEAIFIGDTSYDIEAARRAGVRCIALRCGGSEEQELLGAVAIYDDPADLSSRLDHSPLALDRDSNPAPAPTKLRPRRPGIGA